MTAPQNQVDPEPITLAPLQPLDPQSDVRQYALMVANVFAALQEQVRLLRQQNEILQDIRDAVRGGRPKDGEPRDAGVPHQLPSNSPPPQVPRPSEPVDVPALADAHKWLLYRLGTLEKVGR
jgi:hypothetical protein